MAQRCRLTAVIASVLLLVLATAALAAGEPAATPLRSGTAVSKTDADVFTLINATDDAGKPFWVLTSICTIGERGRIAVLAGQHFDKMQTDQLGVIEDVYVGERVQIGDAQVVGYGAHGLPKGCVILK